MELGAVLSLRDKMSAKMEKASKSVNGMVKQVDAARDAIGKLTSASGSSISINARSNISEVVSAGQNRLEQLQKEIAQKQFVLHAQFGDESFDLSTIDAEIKRASDYVEKGMSKLDGYNDKLAVLMQKQREFNDTTSASTRLGVEQQIDSLKNKIYDLEAAKQALAEWQQVRIEFTDLQRAQAEAQVLETALEKLNSTNVAVRAYVDFKADALKQIYDIDQRLASIGKRIVRPLIDLKDRASAKISPIAEKLKSLGARVAAPVVKLVDKTKNGLTKLRQGLAKIAGTVAYPVVKLKDLATAAVKKVSAPLKALGGKIFSPILKIIRKPSDEPERTHSKLSSIASKAWKATIAAKDKVSGVLSSLKSKVLNLKNLLGSLVIGAGVGKGLQATVGGAMKLENQKVSMQHFIGATNKGADEAKIKAMTDDYVSQLRQNANATPFETGEVIAAGSRAVAVASGNTSEAMKLVTLAEDMAAASGGTKTINDAMEALADLKVGETERLKEFGFKVSADDLKKKGVGGVTSDLTDFYGGASGKLATTGSGLVSTITGAGKSALTDMGAGGLDLLKPQLQELANLMTDGDFMGGIIEKGSQLVSKVVGFGLKVVSFFRDNWPTISESIKKVWTQIQPVVSVLSKTFGGLGKVLSSLFTGQPVDFAKIFPSEGDVSAAIQSVLDLVVPFGTQLIEAIISGLAGLVSGVAAQAPLIVNAAVELLNTLLNSIIQNLPVITQAAVDILLALANGIVQVLPLLAQAGISILLALINGIAQALPTLIPIAVQALLTLVQALIENMPLLIDAAIALLQGLAQGLINALPILLEQAPIIISALVEGIVQAIPQLVTAAISIIQQLVSYLINNLDVVIEGAIKIILALAAGLIQAIPELIAAVPELIGAIIDTIMSTDWLQVGKDILAGIANGLLAGVSGIWDAIKSVGSSIKDGFCSFFGIKSPSRLMKKVVGFQLGAGIAGGLEDSNGIIQKQVNAISNGILGNMEPELPVFRDLDVQNKAKRQGSPDTGYSNYGVGRYSSLGVAEPVGDSAGGGTTYSTTNTQQTSKRTVHIDKLIESVMVTNEADEDRLVSKIIAVLADDIYDTVGNMGEEVME